MDEICQGDISGYKNALNVLWESVIFLGQITGQRYLFCLSIGGAHISRIELPYMNSFSECIQGKNRTFARNFAAQRVEINGVKVHFSAKYFCRKLRYEDWWGSIICFAGKHLKARHCFHICHPELGLNVRACLFRFSALKLGQRFWRPLGNGWLAGDVFSKWWFVPFCL